MTNIPKHIAIGRSQPSEFPARTEGHLARKAAQKALAEQGIGQHDWVMVQHADPPRLDFHVTFTRAT